MPQKLTLEDAQQSLTGHIAAKGEEINRKYGPAIGWAELQQILDDRACTRYPCTIVFDDTPLRDGEFALPVAVGERPEEGFRMHVHPFFSLQPAALPGLVLYQLVQVNYGDFASPTDAEVFGAAALGLDREDYYNQLCELADRVSSGIATATPEELEPAGCGGSCGGGCGCGGHHHA